MRYVCPNCRTADGLWHGLSVGAWEAVGEDLTPDSATYMMREMEWHTATPDGTYGCGECSWEGTKRDLLRLDLDGEPLPEIHPQQGRLLP